MRLEQFYEKKTARNFIKNLKKILRVELFDKNSLTAIGQYSWKLQCCKIECNLKKMATSECTRLTVFPRVHKPNEMENFIYISERYLFNSFFRSYVSIIIMRFSQQTESKSFFLLFFISSWWWVLLLLYQTKCEHNKWKIMFRLLNCLNSSCIFRLFLELRCLVSHS